MDDFIIAVVFMIITEAAVVIAFMLYNYIGTRILLSKHQSEWDAIKEGMILDGACWHEISESYLEYCQGLKLNRHTMFGACFPRE